MYIWLWSELREGFFSPAKEQEMENPEWTDYNTFGGEVKLLVLHFKRTILNIQLCPSIIIHHLYDQCFSGPHCPVHLFTHTHKKSQENVFSVLQQQKTLSQLLFRPALGSVCVGHLIVLALNQFGFQPQCCIWFLKKPFQIWEHGHLWGP